MYVETFVAAIALAFPGEMPNAVKPQSETRLPGEGARPSLSGEDARSSKAEAEKPASPAMHPVEAQIIKFTNAERAKHGLSPLKADAQLLKSARSHAMWMTTRRTLTHTRQAVAENIALGQQSAREVVRSWMNSSGHRANILSRRHGRIGVAAYVANNGQIYWCQQFE